MVVRSYMDSQQDILTHKYLEAEDSPSYYILIARDSFTERPGLAEHWQSQHPRDWGKRNRAQGQPGIQGESGKSSPMSSVWDHIAAASQTSCLRSSYSFRAHGEFTKIICATCHSMSLFRKRQRWDVSPFLLAGGILVLSGADENPVRLMQSKRLPFWCPLYAKL